MKRTILAGIGGCALLWAAAPAAAQENSGEELTAEQARELGNLFGDMFGTADPLSAEQEERLPAAMLVVSKLFPKGTYARMMDESMAPMIDAMMGDLGGNSTIALSQLTGLSPLDLSNLDAERLAKAVALLDPAAEERNSAMSRLMLTQIGEIMLEIEPAYRAGLARAYAVRFTNEELMDLSAYFETDVGKKYAAESFLVFADPQVMSSMNEMMPAMMERLPAIMSATASIESDFPAGRSFSDLSGAEQSQLADLLGVTKGELAQSEPESNGEGPS
ncbi:DUF2059 domain-containing protein [Erythrobacter sp. Alg231-14]|uniref:DUF2059 domain-containing protein n=1 Tax=Erythrobacter sp. Alg231-14 TaxID=1922225 RepID=UPI000D55EA7F